MSDKYYQNEMDREMLLNIQIQKQVLSVLPQMNVSKQFINPTTQEMIDDYKKQFKRPGFKFQMPNYEPELERVGTLEVVFPDTVLARKMKQLEDSVEELTDINEILLPDIELQIKNNRFAYNRLSVYDFRRANKLNSENDEYVKERLKIIQRLAELNTNIRTLNTEIEENNNKKESNIAKITTVQQNNQRKIKDYTDTLKIINFGNINTTQQPGESEQDFLNRLTDIGLIQDDPTDAILYNITEFKKNMRTILNQEWMIENVINSLNPNDRYILNMLFPGFKKLFIEIYGINNKFIELDDILLSIQEFLNKYSHTEESSDTSSIGSNKQTYELPENETFYDADEVDAEADAEVEAEVDADIAEKQAEMEKKLKEDEEKRLKQAEMVRKLEQKKLSEELEKNLNFKKPSEESSSTPIPKATIEPIKDKPIIKPSLPDFKNTSVSINGDKIVFTNKLTQNKIFLRPYVNNEIPRYNESIEYSYNDDDYNKLLRDISSSKLKEENKKLTEADKTFLKNITGKDYLQNFATTFRIILNNTIDEKDTTLFMNNIKTKTGDKRPNFMILYKLLNTVINENNQKGKGIKKQKKKPKKKPTVQKGKSLKDVPSHCEFGKLILLLKKLYQTNMLSVKDKNNINVQGIPNQKVSNDFVNILMKICTNKKVNKKDINNLNQKETILYNVLLSKAGLSKDYDSDIQNTVKTIKNRLALLEGEIQAGNNNNDLKKELYSIIFQLANIGAISISSARKYYNDTVKTYF